MLNYIGFKLLQVGLNCVHESAHSVYLKHVYNGTVADTFLGDDLFGADLTIPIEDRVDNVVKRVRKSTTTAKASMGQTGRGGSSTCKRGGASASTGASRSTTSRGTTTTTTCLETHFLMANPIMGPLATIRAVGMA